MHHITAILTHIYIFPYGTLIKIYLLASQYTFMTELNNKLVEHLKKSVINRGKTSEHNLLPWCLSKKLYVNSWNYAFKIETTDIRATKNYLDIDDKVYYEVISKL
jgi:hypothetical protein